MAHGTVVVVGNARTMRTPVLLLWVVVALAVILPAVRAQRSRGQSQARRPSTEAPSYDDYYYDEEGADEDAAAKKPEKSSSSQSSSRGGSSGGSSVSSRGGKSEPAAEDDYDAPPPSSKSSSSSTAKPSPSSKLKSGSSVDPKPPPPAAASDAGGEPEGEEPPKKTGPISPSALFLTPRKNRLHRPNVHYAARPRPTLPSFIKHPPPLGAISTTVTPKPRSAAVAVTEEPKVTRSTAKPKGTSSSSKRGSSFSGGAAGRKRDRSTTESPASTEGERSNRRFGGTGKKNTSRPRFRAGVSS